MPGINVEAEFILESRSWLLVNYRKCVSHSVVFDPFATSWTVAHQAPLSVEFSM